ncbi:MAG: Asp-tRNA(Asn)/Glu-tRNA(Gln) amidotransferase subunit GatC [Chlamydia sp.]
MKAHINKEIVHQLTRLGRIDCSESEKQKFIQELESILQYVSLLNEVDTVGVEPMYHVLQGDISTPLRNDIANSTLLTQEFLKEAPQQVSQLVKVPKFRKES